MKRNTVKEMIEIIKSSYGGKVVQFKSHFGVEWKDCTHQGDHMFNFQSYQYRVKPEPKPDVTVDFMTTPERKFLYAKKSVCGNVNLRLTFDGETGNLKKADVL